MVFPKVTRLFSQLLGSQAWLAHWNHLESFQEKYLCLGFTLGPSELIGLGWGLGMKFNDGFQLSQACPALRDEEGFISAVLDEPKVPGTWLDARTGHGC